MHDFLLLLLRSIVGSAWPKTRGSISSAVLGAASGFHCPLRMRVIFTVWNRPALRNGSSAEKASATSRLGTLMMNTLPVRVPSSASVPPERTTIFLWRSR
jgi:hypothetical protein